MSLQEPISGTANHNVCSDGIVQPFRLLGWWQWMYRLSPYTYLIEGQGPRCACIFHFWLHVFNCVTLAIGHQLINCSDEELVTLEPPSSQTCGKSMASYISSCGGYLTNPDTSTACQFCLSRAVSTAVRTVKASKKNLRLQLRHSRNHKPTVYVRPIPVTVWRTPLDWTRGNRSTTVWLRSFNQFKLVFAATSWDCLKPVLTGFLFCCILLYYCNYN